MAPWWLALLLAAAALAAWVLDLCWATGHYFIGLVPALAALSLTPFMVLAVNKGRIRHSMLALVLGGLVGGAMYLGHYQIGALREIKAASGRSLPWYDMQFLPSYVRWRMATAVTHSGYAPKADRMREEPTPGRNWFGFAMEAAICTVLVAVAGYRRARRAYGEQGDAWLERSVRSLPASALPLILAALDRRDLDTLATANATGPAGDLPRLDLAIDHPKQREGRSDSGEAFLSLKLVKAEPQGVVLDRFEASKGRLVIDRMRLDGRELSILLPVPGQPDVVRTPPPVSAQAASQVATRRVEKLPEAESAAVLNKKARIVVGLLTLFPIFAMAGGIGLLLLGFGHGCEQGQTLGAVFAVVGFMSAVGGLFEGMIGFLDLGNRHLRRLCAIAVAARAGKLFDPTDPGVRLVEIVPRENWQRVTSREASDFGFLRIDSRQGVLQFEGASQRWHCPVAAISRAVIAECATPGGHGVFVVLAVADVGGLTVELPLRERRHIGTLGGGSRRRRARELYQGILEAMRGHGRTPAAG